MTKDSYREYILKVKPFINISAICKASNVSRQSMHLFLNGIDYALSIEALQRFYSFVTEL